MVCGDGVDIAPANGCPERLTALLALHRRRAYEIPCIFQLIDIAGKFQILRTGLRIDGIALVLCPGHSLDAAFVRQMDDIQRCAGGFCPGDGTLVCLFFHKFRTGCVMIPGIRLALCQKLLCEGVDDLVVLCVYLDQCAHFFRLLQDLIEHTVGHAEVIHHEHLKRRHAVVHRIGDGVQQSAAHILDCHVEGIIHGSLRCAEGIPALDGIHHRFPEILENKVKYGGGPAAGCGSCAGEIAVGRDRSAERHRQMGMRINRTRQHQLSAGIYHLVKALRRDVLSDLRNGFSVDRNIRQKRFTCGNYSTVLYQSTHISAPPSQSWFSL